MPAKKPTTEKRIASLEDIAMFQLQITKADIQQMQQFLELKEKQIDLKQKRLRNENVISACLTLVMTTMLCYIYYNQNRWRW